VTRRLRRHRRIAPATPSGDRGSVDPSHIIACFAILPVWSGNIVYTQEMPWMNTTPIGSGKPAVIHYAVAQEHDLIRAVWMTIPARAIERLKASDTG
jgi:hypothetical protein